MLIAHQSFIIFQTLLHIKEVLKDDTSLHQNLWEYLELQKKKSCTIAWILYEQEESFTVNREHKNYYSKTLFCM